MAAYRWVYDSRHLQADCQEPESAPEPYARQSSTGCLYLFSTELKERIGVCALYIGSIGRGSCPLRRHRELHRESIYAASTWLYDNCPDLTARPPGTRPGGRAASRAASAGRRPSVRGAREPRRRREINSVHVGRSLERGSGRGRNSMQIGVIRQSIRQATETRRDSTARGRSASEECGRRRGCGGGDWRRRGEVETDCTRSTDEKRREVKALGRRRAAGL